jgi:hypothetical protein
LRALRSALRDVGPSKGEGRVEELALGPGEGTILPQMEESVSKMPRTAGPAIGPGSAMPHVARYDKDREGAPPEAASSRPLPLSTPVGSGGEPRDLLERLEEDGLGASR